VNAPGSIPPGAEDGWCDCGWPYTLLIPSGASTPAGTRFKLMVALTDWESDHAGEPHSCGSMSYCGARREYPDRREMGYPLHRPFGGDLVESLSAQSSIAIRDVTIRCRNRRPPE
jgi:tyrosinase